MVIAVITECLIEVLESISISLVIYFVIIHHSDQFILLCYDVLVDFTDWDLLLGFHRVYTIQCVVQDEDY